jgi:hypothetical protein
MKRLHIHIAVKDLQESINFYSTLFGEQPSLAKDDYAKWDLRNPNINIAISTGGRATGVDHIGIQVETPQELDEIRANLSRASYQTNEELDTSCCYAKSDKYWTMDPQGVAWESFLTKAESAEHCAGGVEVNEGDVSCCVPKALERNQPDGKCCVSSPGSSCCS